MATVGAVTGVSKQRVVEAVIIASVTALATSFVTTKVLEQRTSALEKRMDEYEGRQERRYDALQGDLRQIYVMLAELRPSRTLSDAGGRPR